MTTQTLDNNLETLFSFELFVQHIRIDKKTWKSAKELALGVRLLDFPTLLIYQPQTATQDSDDNEKENHQFSQLQCDTFEYPFNKGKSCLFKMNLNSLHAHLSNTPLYAMVLDVKEDVPRLVGTSLISLAKLIERIRCDVEARGISFPSSQGEKAVVDIFNLMGEKIGFMSTGYKLLSLGVSLLPHISEYKVDITTQRGTTRSNVTERVPAPSEQRKVPSPELDYMPGSSRVLSQNSQIGQSPELVMSEAKQGVVVSMATQTERAERGREKTPQSQPPCNEEIPALLDPPHLFYSRPTKRDKGNETDEYKLLNLDLESLRLEDLELSSEDKTPESEMEGPSLTDQRRTVQSSSSQGHPQTHDAVPPSILGEALRQLPLLNALLVELSQLNGQNQTQQQQSPSIHPNLAWIYRPVTESTAGTAYSANSQTNPTRKAPRLPSPSLLKKGPTQGNRTTSTPRGDASANGSKCPTSAPKRLTYGITKTFSLRMKRATPGVTRRHECMELLETQRPKAKGKQSDGKMQKRIDKTQAPNRSGVLNENIDTTLRRGIGIDSAQLETTSQKTKNIHDISQRLSTNKSVVRSKKDRKLWVRIPSAQSRQSDRSDDDAERGVCCDPSDLNTSQPGCDRIRPKNESPSGSSKCSSSRPTKPDYPDSRSDSSGAVEEEYADDFTSLDPTDGYSPEPLSSPEPTVVKTRRGDHHASSLSEDNHSNSSDSRSNRSQRKVTIPVPVKAQKSPQRALRATHVIRPRTQQALALSVSSDNSDGGGGSGGPASIRSVRSRNLQTSSRRPSVSENLRPSTSQSSGLIKAVPVRGYTMDSNMSTDSTSSAAPHEAEEMGDELGSLGFKNKYQHVSELLANKLPGYTL